MKRGWRHRIVTILGATVITTLAVVLTNLLAIHAAFARVPYFGRPAPEVLPADDLGIAIMITVIAFNVIGDGLREAVDPRQTQLGDN